MLILIMCLLAVIVLYALYKDYTVRAGGKALGTAFFFEALKRPGAAESNKRACTAGYRSPSSAEGHRRVTGGKVKAPDPR